MAKPTIPTRDDIIQTYRKRAGRYDEAMALYRLFGFSWAHYRKLAVSSLGLSAGATVVELGCGTGLNLPLLHRAVGPTGRIIGVDLTDAMLAQARTKVRAHGFGNVELLRADMARYDFPPGIGGILSTGAITLVPEYDAVIARGAAALAPGGRFVVLDLKQPDGWPEWLVRLALLPLSPFGVRLASAVHHPWESLERHLPRFRLQEHYLGAAYIAVGEAAPAEPGASRCRE